MPELPEVETVKRGLSRLLPERTIANVTYDWPKSFPNAANDVNQFMIGAKITDVKRRAKVLMIELDTKYSLIVHLKMTGQLVFVGRTNQKSSGSAAEHDFGASASNGAKCTSSTQMRVAQAVSQNNASSQVNRSTGSTDILGDANRWGAGHPNDSLVGDLPDRSTRVTIDFQDGSKLFFNDQRKFGWVRLLPTAEIPNIDFFKKVGPEPLSDLFTTKDFITRVRRRANTSIKAAILDQTVLAGVGNIYADESLFMAKIHPATKVKDVSDHKLKLLLTSIKEVLQLSIDKGGSSDKNYVDAEGGRGSYLGFAQVFKRTGQPCLCCGRTIEKTRVAGRGTHVCVFCQKPPKGFNA